MDFSTNLSDAVNIRFRVIDRKQVKLTSAAMIISLVMLLAMDCQVRNKENPDSDK